MASAMLPGPGLPIKKSAARISRCTSFVKPTMCTGIFHGRTRSFAANSSFRPQIKINCSGKPAASSFSVMSYITEKLDAASLTLQLILICGRNEELAAKLRARPWKMPVHIVGFTKEVHRLMRAADFLIGKPGPGTIAEAMVRKLPVLIECNAWTLPQERYNAEWVKEKGVGIVLKSFGNVVEGVKRMLDPASLVEFRRNVAAQENHAVFEIPEILAKLLGEPGAELRSRTPAPVATHTL